MPRRIALLLVCLLAVFCAPALAETASVIKQLNAPVQVLGYEAEYDDKDDKLFFVEHEVKYKNVAQQGVTAVRFGCLQLNAFNDPLGTFYGFATEESDPQEKDKAVFVDEFPEAVLFEKLGTALLWIDAVRFSDGTFWTADHAQVLEELKKVRDGLTEADLQPKKRVTAR